MLQQKSNSGVYYLWHMLTLLLKSKCSIAVCYAELDGGGRGAAVCDNTALIMLSNGLERKKPAHPSSLNWPVNFVWWDFSQISYLCKRNSVHQYWMLSRGQYSKRIDCFSVLLQSAFILIFLFSFSAWQYHRVDKNTHIETMWTWIQNDWECESISYLLQLFVGAAACARQMRAPVKQINVWNSQASVAC